MDVHHCRVKQKCCKLLLLFCDTSYKAKMILFFPLDYNWDVTDWNPNGSRQLPVGMTQVAYGPTGNRRSNFDIRCSPSIRGSNRSVDTQRSHISQKSDALPGYYSNSGRRRMKESQIIQMKRLQV